jgi:hypothetical protein
MAKRAEFNLSEAIRQYRQAHKGASANECLEALKKDHPKIKPGTLRSTFYKQQGEGKKRTVRRKKPGQRGATTGDGAGLIGHAAAFVRSAGGINAARQALDDLEAALKEL